jgi:hypothetical protein
MKVVIAGSAKLQTEINQWLDYWKSQLDCEVLNFPQQIPSENFEKLYPSVHANFFKDITEADILFIANEEKNGISGYIGAETFAELAFGVAQKLINNQNIKLIIAHLPSTEVQSYNEIMLWLKLGWIEILNHE